ncbi:MAG TPA: DUF4386 family protein, partial [Actinomycetota bacterium]|nr:DUF4386 family protein [Actinomycetota bacterium]
MTRSTERRTAAGILIGATVAANAAFVGLGSTFDYPDVLQKPTPEILELFLSTQTSTTAWFAVLALGAALLAPASVLLARQFDGATARWSARLGVAAAVVQVIGLSRWFLLVPGLAARATDSAATAAQRADASSSFETAHRVLGSFVGETLGYTLTAAWTVAVLVAVGPALARPWFKVLGSASAALIFLGVFVPLDLPGADMANFIGY